MGPITVAAIATFAPPTESFGADAQADGHESRSGEPGLQIDAVELGGLDQGVGGQVSRPNDITHRFMDRVGHPDIRQFPGPCETGQPLRVPRIVLDPIARAPLNGSQEGGTCILKQMPTTPQNGRSKRRLRLTKIEWLSAGTPDSTRRR